MNIDKMSFQELTQLREKIEPAIEKAKAKERAVVLAKVNDMVTSAGMSVKELFGLRGTKHRGIGTARFRNPENPQMTWTGRGRRPQWLKSKIDKGATPDQFAI